MADLTGVKVRDKLRVWSFGASRTVKVNRVTRCFCFTESREKFRISDGMQWGRNAAAERVDQ